MKKLLILPVLLLASCAPLLSAVSPRLILSALPAALQYAQGEKALITDTSAGLTLTNGDSTALEGASVTLDLSPAYNPDPKLGSTVTANGAACLPAGDHSVACSIGSIPGTVDGKAYSYVIRYTGTLKGASAGFYRAASGNRPIFIQLK